MAISPSSSSTASSTLGSAFNVDGIVSGLKTADIIAQMMKLSQAPLNQINAQQAKVQARDAAYQGISSQMITFQGSVQNLLLSTAINTKTSTSSAPTVATATASSSAINGSLSVTVAKLATATSAASSGPLGTPANQAAGALLSVAGPTGANMAITPTIGQFTINGQQISIASDGSETWATLQGKISALTGPAVTLNYNTLTNAVSLTSAVPVQLGSPSDTSNFLSATNLLSAAQTGAAGAYTVASSQLIGEAQPNVSLSNAGLSTAITANGTFQVNGVSIAWANTDSLSNIVSRINSSSAGVTATYDPKQDTVSLTNSNTGAQSISLVDGAAGGLLAALKLTTATQAYGSAAQYTTTQNGVTSATQYSNSNAVAGVVQGVNMTLLGLGTTNLSVTQDTTTATTNLNAFVTQFNSMVDLLDTSTKYDPNTKTSGPLAGDSSITSLTDQLRSLVSQAAVVPTGSAYNTMGDIGISTGAYGSAIGSTNHLVLDTVKLGAALQNNPQAVMQVLAGLTGASTAVPSSTPWMQTASGTPYGQVTSGSYQVTFNPAGNTLSSVFTSSSGTISPATTGTIAAGGTNTTLIPGVSIVALGTLPGSSSTDTINYAVTGKGVLQSLNAYINLARGPSGIFATEHNDATTSIAGFTAQIANQNQMLAQRQATLQAQFTAMEVALTSLQSQGAALSSSLGVASTTAAAGSASSSA